MVFIAVYTFHSSIQYILHTDWMYFRGIMWKYIILMVKTKGGLFLLVRLGLKMIII